VLSIREQLFYLGASQTAVERRCLCTVWPLHSQWPSQQISFITTMRLPILQLSCRIFWQSITSPRSVSPLQHRSDTLRHTAFPRVKMAFEREEICEYGGHTVHKLSHRRVTAGWLAPRESDCSRIDSKVSSDWLPSYIKATPPVLEILKKARYFPDRPRTFLKTTKYQRLLFPLYLVQSAMSLFWSLSYATRTCELFPICTSLIWLEAITFI